MTLGLRTIRQYPTLPAIAARGALPPLVSIVVPLDRTNLVTNPSIELATTGYTLVGGTIARSAAAQYHGTYSLAITPGAGAFDGAFYGTVSMTSGTAYAYSCKFKGKAGIPYTVAVATTGAAHLAETQFIGTGRWQWIRGIYGETATNSRRLYFRKNNSTDTGVFYVDGVQVESCADGILEATTYIDGDQLGLLIGQQPPPYGWNGTPHASTSYRTILTRGGGYLVNLSTYGFLLTGLVGLGMAVPNNVSIPYTVLDGARYQRTTKPPRTISLTGRFQADDYFSYQQGLSDLRQVVDRDYTPIQQPLVLLVEPQDDCGNVIGDFAQIQCIYAGGLDGNDGNLPIEDAAPTFTMYVPFLIGGDAGAALTPQQSIANANAIVQRTPGGAWQALGTGMSGGTSVLALTYGLDGTLYAGGNFTDAGGSGADYIAKWNGTSWSVLKSATSMTGVVRALATGPDGRIYVGGDGINIDGIANADYIAVYDPNANTWAALGTGAASASVLALAFDTSGNLYAAGTFSSMGGVANTTSIAKWNGSVWSSVGNVAGGTTAVNGLAGDGAGNIYAVGNYTSIGGVTAKNAAKYNGTTWVKLATTMSSSANAVVVGPGGAVYVSGDFAIVDGVTVNYVASWNGTSWSPLGVGLNNGCYALAFDGAGILYAGGAFTAAGGLVLPDRGARWNGSAWLPLDINFPGSATLFAIRTRSDGALTLGFNTTGSATAAVPTTVTNGAPALVYPKLVIQGPSSAVATLYQVVNYTNGSADYFNLALSVGETATFDFDPQHPRAISTFQGDISSRVLPGSTALYLSPGANVIAVYASSSTVVPTLSWPTRYNGTADLVN